MSNGHGVPVGAQIGRLIDYVIETSVARHSTTPVLVPYAYGRCHPVSEVGGHLRGACVFVSA